MIDPTHTGQFRTNSARSAFSPAVHPAALPSVEEDRSGMIVSWNAAAERMFGYSGHEAIGRPFRIIVPDRRLDQSIATIYRVIRGEECVRLDTERRRKDGRIILVMVVASAICGSHGRIDCISRTFCHRIGAGPDVP